MVTGEYIGIHKVMQLK